MQRLLSEVVNHRFGRFVIAGGAAAMLFLTMSFVLTAGGLPPFWGSLVAYGMAFAFGYLAQRFWTFGSRHRHGHALPRYFMLQAGCALLSGLLAQGLVDLLGMPILVMSILTTGFASLISYVGSSTWVFPDIMDG